jgi:membrane-bound lytic murein transglycosylase B
VSVSRGRALILTAALGLSAAAPSHALDIKRPDVKAFINEVSARDHLKRAWVAKILRAAELRPPVVESMTRPAERVRAWFEYRAIFITDRRIRDGREFYAAHRKELDAAAQKTGVPGEIITAILGVETSYGRIMGSYRVLDSLATLAFGFPARASFFRSELEQFLLLTREAKLDPLSVLGSYGGAMGAAQFMPSNYRALAVDGDGDGRVDLYNSWPDIIASVANYFSVKGWRAGEPIVAVAELWYPDIKGLPAGHIELDETLGHLRAMGLLFDTMLADDTPAVFLALRDGDGPTYRVGFHNFWVITRYNHSSMYALAVSELATAIAAAEPPATAPAPAPASAPAAAPAAAPDGPR